MQIVAQKIARLSSTIGKLVAWLTLVMVVSTFIIVILRKFFDLGWIWLQESVTWMHAIVFMLAAAYTLEQDEHVRVDVFYSRFSPAKQALINLLGSLFLLTPLCVFIIWSSWDYVLESWRIKETSWQSGGLPALFLLKSIIPLTALLLMLQGLSQALADFLHTKIDTTQSMESQ